MYGPYCIVRDYEVLVLVEDSFHQGRCSCDIHSQGHSAPSGKERPRIDVHFLPSPLLYALDAMTLASELGQKYATQNYPSQGTPICKLHGPSIKPRTRLHLTVLYRSERSGIRSCKFHHKTTTTTATQERTGGNATFGILMSFSCDYYDPLLS